MGIADLVHAYMVLPGRQRLAPAAGMAPAVAHAAMHYWLFCMCRFFDIFCMYDYGMRMKRIDKKLARSIPASRTAAAARTFSRRLVLKSAAAGALLGTTPFIVRRATARTETLRLLMWSDYLPDSFLKWFEADTGIRVLHIPYGSNEELLTKLKATGARGFDLVSPTNDRTGQWQGLDLLQPFDLNRVPVDRLIPKMLDISRAFSWDGRPYHLPYLWGTEAIAWRDDKLTKQPAELSFGDLWSPEVKGRIMGRPHSMMAGVGRYLEGTGALPPFAEAYRDEESMRAIWDDILKFVLDRSDWIKLLWNDADGQVNGFAHNGIIIGQTWGGPVFRLQELGLPVRYRAPKEGAFTWLDGLALPKGAANLDAVYAFIEFAYRPENAGLLVNETGYNAVVRRASEHLLPDVKKRFDAAYPKGSVDNLWPWPSTPAWYARLRDGYRDRLISAVAVR